MATNGAAWTVTQQQETTELGPTGTYVQGVRVYARTPAGDLVSVFIPADQYTVDYVTAQLAAKVATANLIRATTGG